MKTYFLPAFHHHSRHASIIGRILAGYGELEFEMCLVISHLTRDRSAAIKEIFGNRGETKRITRAHNQGLPKTPAGPYRRYYEDTFIAMRQCLAIRNQYAHSTWLFGYRRGLRFTNLEEIALGPIPADLKNLTQYQINIPLLKSQEAYFKYVQRRWTYLNYEAQRKVAKSTTQRWPMPAEVLPPKLHN
jgi:hypothetical protein